MSTTPSPSSFFDVIILGAGVSGLFAAYQLSLKSKKRILLIDKGSDLVERLAQYNDHPASHYYGFGGLGLSEGKYNYSHQFGGQLAEVVGLERAEQLMQHVNEIIDKLISQLGYSYDTTNRHLQQQCQEAGFTMIATKVRHLGRALSQHLLTQLRQCLAKRLTFRFNCEVKQFIKVKEKYHLRLTNGEQFSTSQMIIAVGNHHVEAIDKLLSPWSLTEKRTRLDLGLRIEMLYQDWQPLLQQHIETKLRFNYLDRMATTYCMNPRGRVINKFDQGLIMADGQNYRETIATDNLNFTLFITDYFATSQQAKQYGKAIIQAINQRYHGVVLQRLGDLQQQRASCLSILKNNQIKPTLLAQTGQLSDIIPTHYLTITEQFFKRLSHLLKQPIRADTLLYGVDAKFFTAEKKVTANFETEVTGLFLAGDYSGVTGSLSQAAASGLQIADAILDK